MSKKDQIIEQLQLVEDPELGLDIWTLELVYDIAIKDENVVVTMTFTSPMCPYGPQLVEDVKHKVGLVEGVEDVEVVISFSPVWEPSDDLKEMLGMGF